MSALLDIFAGRVGIDRIALIGIHPIRNNDLGWELVRISLLCLFGQKLQENCQKISCSLSFSSFLATFLQ